MNKALYKGTFLNYVIQRFQKVGPPPPLFLQCHHCHSKQLVFGPLPPICNSTSFKDSLSLFFFLQNAFLFSRFQQRLSSFYLLQIKLKFWVRLNPCSVCSFVFSLALLAFCWISSSELSNSYVSCSTSFFFGCLMLVPL